MLTTELTLTIKAGNGGNGKVSFYRDRRGPDGGNGGRGGDIVILPTTNLYALTDLAKFTSIEAVNGENGGSSKRQGRNADERIVTLPIGTVITDVDTHETFELWSMNDRFVMCRGGEGGLGNWEYRSSENTTPMDSQKGFPGRARTIHINLKLIAKYGLIGLPNAGKSSLLQAITAAQPKIAAYPFTTLEPNLGEFDGSVIADIPGLIEGASTGKGLGITFLKHVERVSVLFHCISCEIDDPVTSYEVIRKELGSYNEKLLSKPEIILLTKTDTVTPKDISKKIKQLTKFGRTILPVSVLDDESLEKFKESLT